MLKRIILIAAAVLGAASAKADDYVRGMNLTEIGGFQYDAADPGQPKTEAQVAVDRMKAIGIRHVVLNPRAVMYDPKGVDVIPMVQPTERAGERVRYQKLINYIHSQGMTVGLRPIFFVMHSDGRFPYVEELPGGAKKTWWHGNIQPRDPDAWFASFKAYLDIYFLIAKLNKVEEFTIGAELYSMTVGVEDQWAQYPYGFPGRWLALLRYARTKLAAGTKVMYDINFTDDSNTNGGQVGASGGELERWRYRLVDLANPADPTERAIWNDLVSFWKELDSVGIDFYRSLAFKEDTIPADFNQLVSLLKTRADMYVSQLDSTIAEIDATIDHRTRAALKEIGYRSINKGFVDPFNYARPGDSVNVAHQAAAYSAIFQAFWAPKFPWFAGINFWDVSVNPALLGPNDPGFSPLGKPQTEEVIKTYFNPGK